MALISWLSDWNRRRLERRKFARRNRHTLSYQSWLQDHATPSHADLDAWRRIGKQSDHPLISVLVPVYNAKPHHLKAALASVLTQTHERWELCIADDASTQPEVREIIRKAALSDSRIKYVFRQTNGHIAQASNSALELATGDFVALLDQDDLLAPHALSVMANEVLQHPDAAIVYSDEDKIDEAGWRSNPHFKPDWNHTLLLSQNYVCHLLMIRRTLVQSVGGFRQGYEGAQDHDLLLRCVEHTSAATIRHVPQVLYHWRVHAASTAKSLDSKPYAQINGCRAVQDHLDRTDIKGDVSLDGLFYRVNYAPPTEWPKVSVVIPTRDKPKLLKQCVSSVLTQTNYPNIEFLIVDNGTADSEALACLGHFAIDPRVRIIRDESPFNYSALNNLAVTQSIGSVICLMNNDIEVMDANWLRDMVLSLLQPDVGIVGCRLYYPDGTLQHAGVIVGLGGDAGHIFRGQRREDTHYMYRPMLRQELSAVTAACLVTRRETFEQLDGLDPSFAVAFNDIDYCLRARKHGWKVIYHPHAELIHHESASRGRDESPKQKTRLADERARFVARHSDFINCDPAYNPNLTNVYENASLAHQPRQASHFIANRENLAR